MLQSHYKKKGYFKPVNPQEFLVLTWSISEVWKAKSDWEPPSGFEPGTSGMETAPQPLGSLSLRSCLCQILLFLVADFYEN